MDKLKYARMSDHKTFITTFGNSDETEKWVTPEEGAISPSAQPQSTPKSEEDDRCHSDCGNSQEYIATTANEGPTLYPASTLPDKTSESHDIPEQKQGSGPDREAKTSRHSTVLKLLPRFNNFQDGKACGLRSIESSASIREDPERKDWTRKQTSRLEVVQRLEDSKSLDTNGMGSY